MSEVNLPELYLKTVITIEEDVHLVPARTSTLVASDVVYVITAWNPGDERPTRGRNNAADRALHDLLVGRGLDLRRAVGADPDSDHFEESWAVVGLDDQQAREIGAEFGQVAVFRLAGGSQTVLACTEDWQRSRPL